MKKIIFILLLITASTFAQKQINNYKYVIVPNKFEFVKKNDQYQTSSLTKFLFNKSGFIAFLANESLPKEISKNRCLALTGFVRDDSGMFSTKSIVELKDCYNNVVFTSKAGTSKNKEYKRAYHEAIRNAFISIKKLNYKYLPVDKVDIVNNKETELAVNKAPTVVNTKPTTNKSEVDKQVDVLYAQPINNGFQLVNTKPEVVFQVLKTNLKDVFIIKDKNGLLYKNGNIWHVESYEKDKKLIKQFQIKF